ncbi:LysR substrate-binding domain-containing protein [Sneathiella marina]|uniref:LysR substrate-binding domain-containing protein n=1 Tax=Sneathiella marina TaxID=2950108 RepID=A0ABY4W4Y4_9PROT|nr:LysR substrate-binding domain-containing protein [Sneathiella marina]USG62062.1 LysR substrate-binding domain-containing protein [Sneathiella marina]
MTPLPPMNWIRSFEVAGRHLNLSHAAIELGVTHGAVSRQVAQLEKHLATQLFIRSTTGLALTTQGHQLFTQIQQGFSHIRAGVEALEKKVQTRHITLTVLPSFAIHWLVIRLNKFQLSNPQVDIRLLTTRRLVDLPNEGVDFGLRYGQGNWPPLESELLLTDDLILVGSPALSERIDLTNPLELRDNLVISDELDGSNWTRWLEAAGLPDLGISDRPLFDDTGIAVQAALKGQGIILGRSSLIEQELEEGRLVQLSPITIPSSFAMYIIYPPGVRDHPHIAAFCNWLHEEVTDNSTVSRMITDAQ